MLVEIPGDMLAGIPVPRLQFLLVVVAWVQLDEEGLLKSGHV